MPLVGSFVLPHGALLLDESKPIYSEPLNLAMKEAARELAQLRPDVVFLSTPHGIALDNDFGLYLNQQAKGSAEWLGEYGEYAVQVQLNRSMALELKSRLSEQGVGVAGITSFSSAVEAPLRWGEAVPLWFIEQALKQQQDEDDKGIERKTSSSTTYIIMSQPTRRVEPEQMAADLRRLGETLSAFFEERTERAVVAISGDLAHTHSRSPDSPYPWSAAAQPFDEAIEAWASSLDEERLVGVAGALVREALSCGYTGFLLLDAALRHQRRAFGKTLVSSFLPSI